MTEPPKPNYNHDFFKGPDAPESIDDYPIPTMRITEADAIVILDQFVCSSQDGCQTNDSYDLAVQILKTFPSLKEQWDFLVNPKPTSTRKGPA